MKTYDITISEVENGVYASVHVRVTTFGSYDAAHVVPMPPQPRSGVFKDMSEASEWVQGIILGNR